MRLRARYPHTPVGALKLLPSPQYNPDGWRGISVGNLDAQHRRWVNSLPTLRRADNAAFDTAALVPHCYRHTYAQRHADAGVPVDALQNLMDHTSLDATKPYYRVGEKRRREAVDRLAALQFYRHGNRVWWQAKTLLDSEHARRAVGEVVVPFGVLHRAVQRQGRRARLPLPVPLCRVRPLPHQRVLPARPAGPPR